MKHLLVGILLALGLTSTFVTAQTVANGPYYATPSWDQTLPVAQRFIVLANMNQQAVLDRETGLVWERGPSLFSAEWRAAVRICMSRTTGGRLGWRLPTVQELLSLTEAFESNLETFNRLPAGHPFSGVPSGITVLWSVTAASAQQIPDAKYQVRIGSAVPFALVGVPDSGASFWCVRSPDGANPQ